MTRIQEFLPYVLPQLRDGTVPPCLFNIRNACITFCEKTHLWVYTLPLIDISEDTADYSLHIPDGSVGDAEDLEAILIAIPEYGVRYKQDGEDEDCFSRLTVTSENELDAESGAWRHETGPTPSKWYLDNVDKQLHLNPIPEDDSTDGLEVTVILKPKRTCKNVPDFLFEDYTDVIAAGALARIFNMPSMPWYNSAQASENDLLFKNAINNAKTKKFIGSSHKPMRVKMRQWI